jgi:hypothetical protein
MVHKTMKMLAVALIAAFALSTMAEAAPAPPKKTVRHRTKHSSRVASGGAATTARKPAAKKKPAVATRSRTGAQANRSTTNPSAGKEAPVKPAPPAARRPTTKPH